MRARAGTQRALVLGFLKAAGTWGATDDKIQRELDMPGNTERPRRRELEKAELIVDSGRRRPTASGKAAIVWVAREYIQEKQKCL